MKTAIKICSLLLVLLLLSAMTITLYAEGGSSTVTATVISTNAPTYTIVVPADLSAEGLVRTPGTTYYKKAFAVNVSDVESLDGKAIEVRVYGDDGVFALKSSDGKSVLPYEVFSDANVEQALQNGDIFATFTQAGNQSGFVRIDQKNITTADTYTGNLRFSFSVSDIEE